MAREPLYKMCSVLDVYYDVYNNIIVFRQLNVRLIIIYTCTVKSRFQITLNISTG